MVMVFFSSAFGLYKTNNFAAISSLLLFSLSLLIYININFLDQKKYIFLLFRNVFLLYLLSLLQLYMKIMNILSTELFYEATLLHQDFYSYSDNYINYLPKLNKK